MSFLLTPEFLRRFEFVATSALTPALFPKRGRILRRGLSQRWPFVLRQFSPVNHPPAAIDNSTSEPSQRVRSLSPLPGGEGRGEGERHTNFTSTNHPAGNQVRGMIVRGMKTQPEEYCFPIPLTSIPLTLRLCAFAPLRFSWRTSQSVKLVATPALTPALSPRRGRILRRVLSQRQPSVPWKFSPANHEPAATGNSASESSRRVRSLSPLPGGEGQGEGERHTNFSANRQPLRLCPFAPLR
jgi:hypothetical protein